MNPKNTLNSVLNTILINEFIATSGQPTPGQFQEISAAGFTTVINLAMPDSDNALPDEGGFVSEAGMNYFYIPVPFDAPTREHLELFLKLMDILKNEKVWVHCALNMRVSAFMFHYQKSALILDETNCVPMLESWKPDANWRAFLEIKHST